MELSTQRLQSSYTVENVGGNGQDPTTEMTHLGLNQPPVFFSSVHLAAVLHR